MNPAVKMTIGAAARAAWRTLWTTILVFVALAVVLAILAGAISGGGIAGFLCSVVAFVLGLVGGVVGGAKRAVAKALHAAVTTAQLGKRIATALVKKTDPVAEEPGWLSRAVMRVGTNIARPMVEAEQRKGTQAEQIGDVVDAALADKAEDMVMMATALAFGIAFVGLAPAIALRFAG